MKHIAMVVAVLAASACAVSVDTADLAPSPQLANSGDTIDVAVVGEPELSGAFEVGPDGTIDLPVLGEVHVEGLTEDDVAGALLDRLSRSYLVASQLAVDIRRRPSPDMSSVTSALSQLFQPADNERADELEQLRGRMIEAEAAVAEFRSESSHLGADGAEGADEPDRWRMPPALERPASDGAARLARLRALEAEAEAARQAYRALLAQRTQGARETPDLGSLFDRLDSLAACVVLPDDAPATQGRVAGCAAGALAGVIIADGRDRTGSRIAVSEVAAAAPLNMVGIERVRVLAPMTLVSDASLIDEETESVRLLFGADRARERVAEGVERLTTARGGELQLGSVTVTLPRAVHVMGRIERPTVVDTPFGVAAFAEPEDPERHVMLRSGAFLSPEAFAALAARLEADAVRFENQALIFVHGFNNGFENAAYRTAQIVHDLQFDGAAYFYSWPSRGELSRAAYQYDRESVLASRRPFREFLELIRDTTGAEQIHVIAHSMGALLTMEVLRDLNADRDADAPLFAQIVLAAPDIDRDVFAELADAINGVADGVTLYASAADTALQVSEQFAGRVSRAGDVPADGPVIAAGVDTIDATSVSTDLFFAINHTRFAEASAIIDDLDELLRDGLRPPEERTPLIDRVSAPEGVFWRFRALSGGR